MNQPSAGEGVLSSHRMEMLGILPAGLCRYTVAVKWMRFYRSHPHAGYGLTCSEGLI